MAEERAEEGSKGNAEQHTEGADVAGALKAW